MRIIGGKYRGKKLISPSYEGVRPTADRAREAVFNILYSMLPAGWEEYRLLELFTGSGAFGLEALSRGVSRVCLADINIRAAEKNLALFPQEKERVKLLRADVLKLPSAKEKYNLFFADAPYNQGLSEAALQGAAVNGWLERGCICVIETEKNEAFSVPENFRCLDERVYGIAKFWFLQYEPGGA